MRLLVNAALGLATLLYPLTVYFGSPYLEPWAIAGLLIVLLLIRLKLSYARRTIGDVVEAVYKMRNN